MKIFCLSFWILMFCTFGYAEEFYGAPVMAGGQVINKTDSILETVYPISYNETLNYYKEAFKGEPNVKFRNNDTVTYIDELGNRSWRLIKISALDAGRTKVIISKDNWIWTLKNIILPFVGVFVVLFVLYLATLVLGAIFSRAAKRH